MEFANKILEKVKRRLKILDNSQDDLLSDLIEDTIQSILNYCNIWVLPEELIGVVTRFMIDAFYEMRAQEMGVSMDNVSSLSDAGSSINFFTLKTAAEISAMLKDRIPNITELDRFKLLYKYPKPEV